MEEINLLFNGDFPAVAAAHNLLAAAIDASLYNGNPLRIDPSSVMWPRTVDMNDRQLRYMVTGLGGKAHGQPRETGFIIVAASEIMAVLALASDLKDLRARLSRIVVASNVDGQPVTAEDLKATGAMAVILKDALKPNLLQTLEGGPALVHCGPFGNIATGTSSVVADLVAMRGADYVVTEAGFGAGMGAERFFDVKCRVSGLVPDTAVIVATVRALKAHSGRFRIRAGRSLPDELLAESPSDVEAGIPNLVKHIEIVRRFGIEPVVAINAFPQDHDSEHEVVREVGARLGVRCAVTSHVAQGGVGAEDLARVVMAAAEDENHFDFLYPLDLPLVEKIETIAREIYGADGIDLAPAAARALADYEQLGFGHLPVVIAKTHLSISSDPTLLGAPTDWRMPVREVRAAVGAGYVYAICGDMSTMPGLPTTPNAEHVDLTPDGGIMGLS
jgi:formate--tetrahydrofolate ligase